MIVAGVVGIVGIVGIVAVVDENGNSTPSSESGTPPYTEVSPEEKYKADKRKAEENIKLFYKELNNEIKDFCAEYGIDYVEVEKKLRVTITEYGVEIKGQEEAEAEFYEKMELLKERLNNMLKEKYGKELEKKKKEYNAICKAIQKINELKLYNGEQK